MSKTQKIEAIKQAVERALSKYDIENVDIVQDGGKVEIVYHSRHNSFAIESNVCVAKGLKEKDISDIADIYDIGYCW